MKEKLSQSMRTYPNHEAIFSRRLKKDYSGEKFWKSALLPQINTVSILGLWGRKCSFKPFTVFVSGEVGELPKAVFGCHGNRTILVNFILSRVEFEEFQNVVWENIRIHATGRNKLDVGQAHSRLLGSQCLRMTMKHKANSKTQGGASQL